MSIISRFITPSLLIGTTLSLLSACSSGPNLAMMPRPNIMPLRMNSIQAFAHPRLSAFGNSGAPADYYAPAKGLQGQHLLHSLNSIVSSHIDLGYSHGRDVMFGHVDDLDNDDVVTGVYTRRRLSGVTNRHDAYRNATGLNCEHTWPKSKGAGGGPAKADLHHLFPTDINTNSKRSSFPFGMVVHPEYQNGGSKLGRDPQGRTVFEPRDDHKGNVARALFYFYTVYGRNASLANFRVEEPVLHRWHQEDPVDAAEIARNDAIFKYQKNRNPYVDHPEFVSQVGRFQ